MAGCTGVFSTGTGAVDPATQRTPGLAATLFQIETALRNRATRASERLEMSHLQPLLYRRLGRKPGLADEVRPLLPMICEPVMTTTSARARPLRRWCRRARPPLETWPPGASFNASAEALLASCRRASAATGVPWQVLAALNLVETGFGRFDGVSVANAQGPMQFLLSTWAEPGIGRGNNRNPDDAIQAAARYLLRSQPEAFASLYHWQIHLRTTATTDQPRLNTNPAG